MAGSDSGMVKCDGETLDNSASDLAFEKHHVFNSFNKLNKFCTFCF